jgi:N-acetylmuramate 1-kinase
MSWWSVASDTHASGFKKGASIVNALESVIFSVMRDAGFGDAQRIPLAQDASTRSYERLRLGDRTAILMKAPPGLENAPCPPDADTGTRHAMGWNALSRLAAGRVEAFVGVAEHLRSLGLSSPEIYAADIPAGIAVLEDFGEGLLRDVIIDGGDEVSFYAAAGEMLAALHDADVPQTVASPIGPWPILDFDSLALEVNADLFVDWVPVLLGQPTYSDAVQDQYHGLRSTIIGEVTGSHVRAFTLRDFHAENIVWLGDRTGNARLGLLDFQDAVHGYRAWDFSMLLHDARRDVSAAAADAALSAYCAVNGTDRAVLEHELALQGALNTLRIIGIFSRLIARDGKAKYRAFMPREVGHLRRILQNEALAPMRTWIEAHAPLDALERA